MSTASSLFKGDAVELFSVSNSPPLLANTKALFSDSSSEDFLLTSTTDVPSSYNSSYDFLSSDSTDSLPPELLQKMSKLPQNLNTSPNIDSTASFNASDNAISRPTENKIESNIPFPNDINISKMSNFVPSTTTTSSIHTAYSPQHLIQYNQSSQFNNLQYSSSARPITPPFLRSPDNSYQHCQANSGSTTFNKALPNVSQPYQMPTNSNTMMVSNVASKQPDLFIPAMYTNSPTKTTANNFFVPSQPITSTLSTSEPYNPQYFQPQQPIYKGPENPSLSQNHNQEYHMESVNNYHKNVYSDNENTNNRQGEGRPI